VCFAARAYPTRADSLGVRPFARGGRPRFTSLTAWKLASIE